LGNVKDPGCIVLDEIASLPITFFLVPMNSWIVVAAGFALHRLFDISKPPPARQLERLPEGLGIMADDWAAGVYSNLVLHALIYFGVLR
jgi:phosphatidylglycerophosphatase A